MWLSEKSAQAGIEPASHADVCEITIGGGRAAGVSDGEYRELDVAAPGGYYWLPEVGDEALMIDCADGSRVVSGRLNNAAAAGISPGEVYIKSKAASVYMRNDGSMIINGNISHSGDINISGEVTITGTLIVNGKILG